MKFQRKITEIVGAQNMDGGELMFFGNTSAFPITIGFRMKKDLYLKYVDSVTNAYERERERNEEWNIFV